MSDPSMYNILFTFSLYISNGTENVNFIFPDMLALEAIAIGLHSTFVWEVATGEETSDVNAQTSE